ncbi:glutathione peroxidase [Faunimonas pinastri]|uniref:Glutathione peroxidase n=1 Tax=Faunimonas pinastri TaxID=1855383 RepID=A0A1H9K0U7_9HYPH|nr:glutathione peroxidase [Faunimonas pinastri]SEQ92543.1 glutathione peroxidase [Faunimonas pinastri]
MTSAKLDTIPLTRIDGSETSLADYAGKVLLVVNTASKCGLTPQYEALEALYREKHGAGLEVLGFPANNFKGQEPGTDEEIASFCSMNYDVSFPLFSKVSVKGEDMHPLYRALTEAAPEAAGPGTMRARLEERGLVDGGPSDVLWNFEKFLIGRDGAVVGRFAPDVTPDAPELRESIDRALSATG